MSEQELKAELAAVIGGWVEEHDTTIPHLIDALLAKYEIKRKEPRYRVQSGHLGVDVIDATLGRKIATFWSNMASDHQRAVRLAEELNNAS